MLLAAVYARYSSALQRPTSIHDQIALCRDAAPRLECEISAAHVYSDEEISGPRGTPRWIPAATFCGAG